MNAMPFSVENAGCNSGQPQVEPQLRVIKGGVVLGRVTDLSIDETDFRTSNTIIKMSAAATDRQLGHKNVNHKRVEYVIKEGRKATTPLDVVKTVLPKTHKDLGEIVLKNLLDQVGEEYVLYENEVQNIGFDSMTHAVAEHPTQVGNTDLMRGMVAFTDATQEQWGTVYDDTVLRPSQTFARWLLLTENIHE